MENVIKYISKDTQYSRMKIADTLPQTQFKIKIMTS